MTEWSAMVDKVMNLKKQVKISLIGKYVELQDAYISVVEALKHSGYANDAEIKLIGSMPMMRQLKMWQNSLETGWDIVPGGFGQRGTEGRIKPSSMRVNRTSQCWVSAWGCS